MMCVAAIHGGGEEKTESIPQQSPSLLFMT